MIHYEVFFKYKDKYNLAFLNYLSLESFRLIIWYID